jgi:hypothetical protein
MGLKFRRGTTAQKSGSLAFGEPYVNTTLGTLQIGGETGDITLGSTGTGSTGNFGAISGSGLDITGNANIAGNLTLGGAITIGDATTDTVNVVASLSSSLIPQTTNAFDLGSASKIWRDLYISTGSIKFIDNGNVVGTLSTTANGLNFGSNITMGTGRDNGSTLFTIGRRDSTDIDTNIVMGINALGSGVSITGVHNTAIGDKAGYTFSTGSYNIMVGWQAGTNFGNGGAERNVIVGNQSALQLAKYGGSIPEANTFIGDMAGGFVWTGVYNTAMGAGALYGYPGQINQFKRNTAVGSYTALNVRGISNNNIYIGNQAGPNTMTQQSYKFYVGNGDTDQQPYMYGDMSNTTRSLDINAPVNISGSLNTTGSARITKGLIIGTSGSIQSLGFYPNALTINGNAAGTYGGAIFLAKGDAHQWGIISDNTDDLVISNNNSFSTRKVKIYDSADKIEFTYSGSETDFGAGFHNIRFDANGIIPAQTNQYDLGSATNIWRDLYISQNSIKIVDTTGSIISTISTNANGSQNFTNGIIVTGSIVGSIAATNGVVSGSSQITFSGISSLPTLVSGSSQITFSGISSLPTLVSGSSQITYASISSIPSGIVSGSSQVTLSSTTGYGSILNQAVLTTSSPTFAGLTINGAITATGDITAYYTSDKRHKNNIQTIPNALEKVTKLNGVTWEWNDDVHEVTKSTPKTGLIAQEVQEVLPEVVKTRDDGFLALDYSKMMGLMVEAIKEQQKQIDSLLIKINQLENK